ncbi:methyltransferase, FxLD system [Catenulispora pinisilvae]|uniref:methyltransferase, FxLD system n=1 Tax=Catenulispora pinisilvae TaxID=2705253 RepID=UPI002B265AE5|nr:methyltransferase, FxLD system [Catenulispora pinisilvae]
MATGGADGSDDRVGGRARGGDGARAGSGADAGAGADAGIGSGSGDEPGTGTGSGLGADPARESADSAEAAAYRAALADRLIAEGAVTTAEVAAAVRVVPRHLFTPGLALGVAYANQVVFVKRDRWGVPTSSVSAPDIQAIMLEQADIRAGMRVLEVGSGGYNAALMAELVGAGGEVTSVDIDRQVAERARRCLDAAGYGDVRVVVADAEAGVPAHAPYDRIVVTVEAWDLPPAWRAQLTPHGRIVVPLLLRGMTRSIALDREGDRLVSRSTRLCGFVKMQGAGSHPDAGYDLDDGDLSVDVDDLRAIPGAAQVEALLEGPRAERWSGVHVWRWEPWDTLPLWLATVFPGYCQLNVHAPDTEALKPALATGTPAIATPTAFAYLTARPLPDGRIELGAHAFGPDAAALASDLAASTAVWDRDHRQGAGPVITAWPIDAPIPDKPIPDTPTPAADLIAVREHVRLTVDWR